MRSFTSINIALSSAVHWRLPESFSFPFAIAYEQIVLELGDLLESGTVLDIGAGLTTVANKDLGLNERLDILGLDVLEAALRDNKDLDYRLVADACKPWPLADSSMDMIISRSVIEHLADTGAFARECHRVLKPDGYSVHLLPGRNAPFAILNRMLPERISRRLLDWAFPDKKELLGFTAYYSACTFQQITDLFEQSGLKIEHIHCRYYQSTYYGKLFPVYLVSVLYDLLVWRLGIKRLSSQLLVIASRPAEN